jgi:hypothetical protein
MGDTAIGVMKESKLTRMTNMTGGAMDRDTHANRSADTIPGELANCTLSCKEAIFIVEAFLVKGV